MAMDMIHNEPADLLEHLQQEFYRQGADGKETLLAFSRRYLGSGIIRAIGQDGAVVVCTLADGRVLPLFKSDQQLSTQDLSVPITQPQESWQVSRGMPNRAPAFPITGG